VDRKQMLVAIVSVTAVSLTIIAVTASSSISNTPLYTFRMEQASSKLNFLPVPLNEFTYTTEKGYDLHEDVKGSSSILAPPSTAEETCETCDPGEYTCSNQTCWNTCLLVHTCQSTCWNTCPNTCSTCGFTCGGETCKVTCEYPTCPWTCETCDLC